MTIDFCKNGVIITFIRENVSFHVIAIWPNNSLIYYISIYHNKYGEE